jgi:hypothetical protein
MRVSANGGNPERLINRENYFIASPQILPDGKTVLFTHVTQDGLCQIEVQPLESGERKVLFPGATATYLPTGHIVYAVEDNLFAVPFDVDTLKVMGEAVSVVQGVFRAGFTQVPHYAVSDGGMLAYVPGEMGNTGNPGQKTLAWVDREGKEDPLAAEPKDYASPRISPDGTKVALTINTSGNPDIWIWDIVRENMTRLTFDEAADLMPLWTRDGKRIVFYSNREASLGGVYWKSADGTGTVEKLGSAPDASVAPASWSGDGKTLVVMEITAGNADTPGMNFNIGTLPMEGDRERETLLKEKYRETLPQVSPDGRWMAYVSDESSQTEIYVRPFPDVDGGKWQVSQNGGTSPLWSPDGRELFYRNDDSVMAVSVESGPSFEAGKPRVLFKGNYVRSVLGNSTSWDINPKDKRFLMVRTELASLETTTKPVPRRIVLIMNWFEELRERVPVN